MPLLSVTSTGVLAVKSERNPLTCCHHHHQLGTSLSIAEPRTPTENVIRGTLFSLIALPIGVAIFVVVWNLGFIASIVSVATALLTVFLYRLGAGGVISRVGALCVTAVVIVTVGLSILAGIVSEVAIYVGEEAGVSPFEAITLPGFWDFFTEVTSDPAYQESVLPSVGIAILFAGLGVFGTLRKAFTQQSEAEVAPAAYAPYVPITPAVSTEAPATAVESDNASEPKAPTV